MTLHLFFPQGKGAKYVLDSNLGAPLATYTLPCSCRLGLLQVGDRVLSINGVRMEGVMLQQALKFVQEAGDIIEMEVEFDVTGRPCDIM